MKSELEELGYYTLRNATTGPSTANAGNARVEFFALVDALQADGMDFKEAFFSAARQKPAEYALCFGGE